MCRQLDWPADLARSLSGRSAELASHIADTKAGHFDPAEFADHYENAPVELLRQKQAGPSRVINLIDALRRSIGADKPAAAVSRKRGPASRRSSNTRRTG